MPDLGDSRFDSWKQIAAYLNRNLRTVRRWEQERGLPVHRVPGGEHGGVFAYRGEIDDWLLKSNEACKNDDDPAPSDIVPRVVARHEIAYSADVTPAGAGVAGQGLSQNLASKRRANTVLRRIYWTTPVLALIVATVALAGASGWLIRARRDINSADRGDRIAIDSVSPILSTPNQTIVIRGSGFGLHTRYLNTDIPFIAIRDKTSNWATGRIIPQNWDEVTLSVQSWQDDQIIVTNFSGAYGSEKWELRAGDKIEVAVWNPQTGRGPALFNTIVTVKP